MGKDSVCVVLCYSSNLLQVILVNDAICFFVNYSNLFEAM